MYLAYQHTKYQKFEKDALLGCRASTNVGLTSCDIVAQKWKQYRLLLDDITEHNDESMDAYLLLKRILVKTSRSMKLFPISPTNQANKTKPCV